MHRLLATATALFTFCLEDAHATCVEPAFSSSLWVVYKPENICGCS